VQALDNDNILTPTIFEEINRESTGTLDKNEESKFVSVRQIIEDEALNYRPTVYKRSVNKMTREVCDNDEEDDPNNIFYVEFKKKKLVYRGKKSHLITMTDITASLKYSKVRERMDLLNSL
jgi:hypothetical protein